MSDRGEICDGAAMRDQLVVIGGGPAGLTAAYAWTKEGGKPLVLEATDMVGGIARTEVYKGFRFDIGGHRFFTKVEQVQKLWEEILGEEFLTRPRMSRIYYQGKFYSYPLQLGNALKNLGVYESVRIMLSYLKWKVKPSEIEENFEQWVSNRFGGRLYWHFFRTYTEKVWGIPCTSIRADWAAQRIKNLSLKRAVLHAITGNNQDKQSTLINEFKYPRLGPGQMWESCRDKINAAGGKVRMNSPVTGVHTDGKRVQYITVTNADGEEEKNTGDHYITSMPLSALVRQITPKAPQKVLDAVNGIKYRDFLIVALIIDAPEPFPDNWIYIHSPEVRVGRIQNFRSWSEGLVPNDHQASLGMEYFCQEGDGLWKMDDAELIKLATKEIGELNLAPTDKVVDGCVVRQEKAYPVYDEVYKENVDVIREYLQQFENLQTVGRNGMHRYNNQDHSMLTALLAVRNLLGERHDLWSVNVERSYHEDFKVERRNDDDSNQHVRSNGEARPAMEQRQPGATGDRNNAGQVAGAGSK